MLSAADIARVRAEHRLVDVLARAGIATPAGGEVRRFVMINCPMPGHDDSTPSMMVQPQLDRYHCFGCGSHGDVLQLVRDLEGIRSLTAAAAVLDSRRSIRSFTSSPTPRAAERQTSGRVRPRTSAQLDRSTGLPPASVEAPDLGRTSADRILEINEQAWRYLTAPRLAERARTYLGERGIELDALETEAGRPLAGHTPGSPTGLSEHLVRRGFTLDELVDAGWLSRWSSGRLLDRYRHRVLIPVRDRLDRLVGVYARDMTGRSSAKYLNTPETLVFKKRDLLYRPTTWELAPEGSVVVCEGSLDALAIAAAAASIGRSRQFAAVAPSGTALSLEQACAVLALHHRPPVLCADADDAGRAAMVMWASELTRLGRECLVTVLPSGEDPAEWLDRRGTPGLAAFVLPGLAWPAVDTGPAPVPAGGFVASAIHEELVQLGSKDDLLRILVLQRLRTLAGSLHDADERQRFVDSAAGSLAQKGLGSAAALRRRIVGATAAVKESRSTGTYSGAPAKSRTDEDLSAFDRRSEVGL